MEDKNTQSPLRFQDNSLSYDGEQLEEEELEDKSGEEPEDGDQKQEEEISKDSPMYVPKGIYFQHDSRSGEPEDENVAKKSVDVAVCINAGFD